MITISESSLRLTALTLRGIGSYAFGARLDIRPLTILCGMNGSGKSTWLKALDLLKESHANGLLPFDSWSDTNALIAQAEVPGQRAEWASGQADRDFGPLGTIGLEFVATSAFCLPTDSNPPEPPADERQLPQTFLWLGRCPAKTRFRLRIAHPDKLWRDDTGEELYDFVQLTIDERYVLEFKRRVFYGGSTSLTSPGEGKRDDPYALRCSREFIPGETSNSDDWSAEIRPTLDRQNRRYSIQVVSSQGSPEIANSFCELAVKRFRDLTGLLLSGYFHIGAIRTPHDYEINDTPRRAELIEQRYVGFKGEGTIALLQEYAHNLMRDSRPPHTGHIDQSFPRYKRSDWHIVASRLTRSAEERQPSALRRIWEMADPEIRRQLVEQEQRASTGEYDESLLVNWADLLNSVLTCRELYQPNLWPELDEESRYLIERGMERLSADEIGRLNRLLIEAAAAPVPHCTGYLFETFVSVWLDRLVQVQVGGIDDENSSISCSDDWTDKPGQPTGFLVHDRRHWIGPLKEPHYDKTDRFLHACLGNVSPSRKLPSKATYLSSGFHQIAPLVVQAGLMKKFEIMAVENPEVHLHPSLQLEIAGFLMTQAHSGKTIIIETHSDLIIRRIQRAILEEEEGISQAEIQICFASLERNSEAKLAWSQLTPLKVNDRGQISNWPPGFMDDDVKESRRLIETMYDSRTEGETGP